MFNNVKDLFNMCNSNEKVVASIYKWLSKDLHNFEEHRK